MLWLNLNYCQRNYRMFVLFETMLAADLSDDMLVKRPVGCGKWQKFFLKWTEVLVKVSCLKYIWNERMICGTKIITLFESRHIHYGHGIYSIIHNQNKEFCSEPFKVNYGQSVGASVLTYKI